MTTVSPRWEVYIIQTESEKLYTGITNNFERRFANHMNRPQWRSSHPLFPIRQKPQDCRVMQLTFNYTGWLLCYLTITCKDFSHADPQFSKANSMHLCD